jgi:hypothetical protein
MLEIADKGFDSLSHQIDAYINEVKERTEGGDFDIELDSVSLEQFVHARAKDNGASLAPAPEKDASRQLVSELRSYGIKNLKDLQSIIPPKYAEVSKDLAAATNIFGLLRDWMILNDYERYRDKAWKHSWSGIGRPDDDSDMALYRRIVGDKKAAKIFEVFEKDEENEDGAGT